jgi:hypothetical protein
MANSTYTSRSSRGRSVIGALAFGLLSLTASIAQAAHGGGEYPGSSDDYAERRLLRESEELDFRVQRAPLNYGVKSQVSYFVGQVREWVWCEDRQESAPGYGRGGRYEGPSHPNYGGERRRHHHPSRSSCQREENQVWAAFDSVRHYLSDTRYDFPRVFSQFEEVRYWVNELRNDGYPSQPGYPGHGNPSLLEATGSLDSMGFRFQGSRQMIHSQCLSMLGNVNARWVQNVWVNGQSFSAGYGRFFDGYQACSFVSQYAR